MATANDAEGNFDSGGRPVKLSTEMSDGLSLSAPKTPGGAVPKGRGRKIGHRRVDEKTGTVTFKKKPTSELMAAIQLGIGQSVGGLSSKPERDLLMQDFGIVQQIFFPSEGSNITPAHHYSDFRFKTYAPLAFRYFRELFNIRPDDFMLSLCDDTLTELSNPGAGGSIFYISEDDEFIIKTAQHKEADFLQKLLPGYYMNLNQNPRTLLPKFYGLYCYQCGGKNIRFVVMNNILPSYVKMHEKYDLKGSTYKRKASKSERAKNSPTLKDLDFMDLHPEGLLMEKDTYEALIKTVQRDCRVLESFKIMDYSLLVGVHNLDIAGREKAAELHQSRPENTLTTSGLSESQGTNNFDLSQDGLSRGKSLRTKVTQYSTPMESIQAHKQDDADEFEDEDIPPGGIPAKNSKGERLLLYLGIIDILQRYKLRKKFEHTLKSMVTDGDSISVTRPSFYSERFQKFFMNTVFRKAPSPLKHSPSKRKPGERYGRTTSMTEDGKTPIPGTTGGRPDLLIGSSTPPPTFTEALSTGAGPRHAITHLPQIDASVSFLQEGQRSDKGYFQTIQQQEDFRNVRVRHSPLSMSESTPTYTDFTEGTPSYTASSPSCSSEVLDSQVPNLPLDKDTAVSQSNLSVEDSPSKVMLTSSSTSASYYSATSVLEVNDRENSNSSSHVINSVGTNPNNVGVGRTVEIAIGNGDTVEKDYLKSVIGDYKHSKIGVSDVQMGTLEEPRVSVVSQKSSDTSFSTQSGYTDSVVSGYSESIVSHSTASTEKSGQSDSTDMSWNASEGKHQKPEVAKEIPEEESASTYL